MMQIAVIGLGYVGLPLAVALSKHYAVTGFDINTSRVNELHEGIDGNQTITAEELRNINLKFTHYADDLNQHDIFILTIPTPIDEYHNPDLRLVTKAADLISPYIQKGNIVVLESTVYPGVTEDILGTTLASNTGLKSGHEFFLGYSPERINPGDSKNTIDKITKVIAGQTPAVTNTLATVYGKINGDNIYIADNIKTAEAAKVIENTQRDVNIALINEFAQIFNQMDISIYKVLEAAKTKWNFLDFQPGLVGGHCIGVDPYYLAFAAKLAKHEPEIILAGRNINESMANYLADTIDEKLCALFGRKSFNVLVLGATFKENVPDTRNSKVFSLINRLKQLKNTVTLHDPLADGSIVAAETGLTVTRDISSNLNDGQKYDAIAICVKHDEYQSISNEKISSILKPKGLFADIKNIFKQPISEEYTYWSM